MNLHNLHFCLEVVDKKKILVCFLSSLVLLLLSTVDRDPRGIRALPRIDQTTYVFRPPLDSVVTFCPQLVVEEAVEKVDLDTGAGRRRDMAWLEERGDSVNGGRYKGVNWFDQKSLKSFFVPISETTTIMDITNDVNISLDHICTVAHKDLRL